MVNKYLKKIKIDEMKKCNKDIEFGFIKLLIDAKSDGKTFSFMTDGKQLVTTNFKHCVKFDLKLIDTLNFYNDDFGIMK